jgi:hypothetical protein
MELKVYEMLRAQKGVLLFPEGSEQPAQADALLAGLEPKTPNQLADYG